MFSRPVLWMYWEGPCPAYIDLCFETIEKQCKADFHILRLNPDTSLEYLVTPQEREVFQRAPFASVPQKVDFLRICLLYHHGGIWMDSDMICVKSMKPYWDYIQTYDYVGFGCYHRDCQLHCDGTGYPANWVMITRARGDLISEAYRQMWEFTDKRHPYHALGKDLLRNALRKVKMQKPYYAYYHVSSRCVERSSSGEKITNDRLLSFTEDDCGSERIFVPLYNTAPGFPLWFRRLSRHELLSGKYLVSHFFRQGLSCSGENGSGNRLNGNGKKSM